MATGALQQDPPSARRSVPPPENGARSRARLLVFPREHGAWGILLVPLFLGAWLGFQPGSLPRLAWFTGAVLAVFLLRTPLESWLGASALRAQTAPERRLVQRAAGLYALFAIAALGALLQAVDFRGLLWLGVAAVACGVAQAGLKRLRRETRVLSQIVGAVGLTATAPAAYYVAAGALDAAAYLLWMLSWLFAAHQIHYVHLRIHAARPQSRRAKLRLGAGFLAAQSILAVLLVVLALALHGSPILLLVFLPAAGRAALWFMQPPAALAVRRLGFSELGHNLAFGVLVLLLL